MSIKVGINGFGRIGRMVFPRQHANHPDNRDRAASTICALPITWHTCCKYDTMHGQFEGDGRAATENSIIVNGKEIPDLCRAQPRRSALGQGWALSMWWSPPACS
ncbi:MAG: glyceraldehyde 3-phosphate dehydrogenase NAD-binding domain-containing protein [Oscillospiraceae bacterium]